MGFTSAGHILAEIKKIYIGGTILNRTNFGGTNFDGTNLMGQILRAREFPSKSAEII